MIDNRLSCLFNLPQHLARFTMSHPHTLSVSMSPFLLVGVCLAAVNNSIVVSPDDTNHGCDGRINAMVEMLKVQRSRCIVKY
jgi:hypothetical protein